METPKMPHFGLKELFKTLVVIILTVLIFLSGKYYAGNQSERKPIILNQQKTSISIDLRGAVTLYDYSTNTVTVVPDSMVEQIWLLNTSIVKNQSTTIKGGKP